MSEITFISIIAAVIIITAVVASLITAGKMRRKVAYMLDALEDKELNFRFDEKRLRGRQMNKTLNRLRNIFDKERKEIMEQEKFFGLMLDHVKTGMIVSDKDGRIIYTNSTATVLLGLATLSHIRQLRTIGDSLYRAFVTVAENNKEEVISFYNESGKITIALTASEATIGNENVKIIAFNNISGEIAEQEQESWSKLIRVLTHEIMNTVTPIASLSETLLSMENTNEEVKSGLDTISQSSRNLIKFVNNYRNLTRIAPPAKKAFYVKELAERVMNLTKEQRSETCTACSYIEKSDDVLLYADEGQITQILINLIKNAVQAEAKNIVITSEINPAEHVIITVANDGCPISKESLDDIFVPFYTTKQDGTGIGLSISRQIMRMHNGSLSIIRSDMECTVFCMIFR